MTRARTHLDRLEKALSRHFLDIKVLKRDDYRNPNDMIDPEADETEPVMGSFHRVLQPPLGSQRIHGFHHGE